MAYDLAKMTNNGNALLAKIISDKSSLSIDKIEVSDTQLSSSTDITTMTSINHVVQTIHANGFDSTDSTLIISSVLDNTAIKSDYKAWVFGIWGSDASNGASQLITVATSTNSPDTIPAFSGSTPVSYTYKFNIGFSNADKVVFNTSNDGYALNDSVVHLVGNETIGGQKKFDLDPTDASGNAYAKTVDVNQQLDKKVNTADATNWQESKITADDGSSLNFFTGTTSLTTQMQSAFSNGAGMVTTTIDSNVTDSPTTNSMKGWVNYQSGTGWETGYGEFFDNTNQDGYACFITDSYVRWVKFSDDAKVVHLSGANNFDTVPTVKNNPLLLASSLPSDLARTSQDTNFTGKLQKNGQDVAIDSQVVHRNPDTGAVSDSVNFTAGLQSGGVSVATSDDIKSIEDMAWREVTSSYFHGSFLFRDNQDGTASLVGTVFFTNPSQQYNGQDDFIIPLPDGYRATGLASSGEIQGFRNWNGSDVSLDQLNVYFPGSALHLYSSYSSNKSIAIPLCSTVAPSGTSIVTSSPLELNVAKTN